MTTNAPSNCQIQSKRFDFEKRKLTKKAMSGMLLALLVTGMFAFAFNIQRAHAAYLPSSWIDDSERVLAYGRQVEIYHWIVKPFASLTLAEKLGLEVDRALVQDTINYLASIQAPDGNILGYAPHALRGFIYASQLGYAIPPETIEKAIEYSKVEYFRKLDDFPVQTNTLGSYKFNLYALLLACENDFPVDREFLRNAVQSLLTEQQADGSWPSKPALSETTYAWQSSVKETAWAVECLLHAQPIDETTVSEAITAGALWLSGQPLYGLTTSTEKHYCFYCSDWIYVLGEACASGYKNADIETQLRGAADIILSDAPSFGIIVGEVGSLEVLLGLIESGFVSISEAPPIIAATIDINPDTLKLKSKGKPITAYIELPEDYNVNEIDISTIRLNGEISAKSHPTKIGDYDKDGVLDLMVRFKRAEVMALLSGGEATLTITGKVGDTPFEGSDIIRVIEE